MLKQIEKKLGKTVAQAMIEEELLCKKFPYGAEYSSPFLCLNDEEYDYLIEHWNLFRKEKAELLATV